MQLQYVYPASFCPPTFGHWHTVVKAAEIFPNLTLICSENPQKSVRWFTPAECRDLWHSYVLPPNVKVETLAETKLRIKDMSCLVMVRGVRDALDADYEKKVMLDNQAQFGLDKFFYLFSAAEFKHISSSHVRTLAENLALTELSKYVSALTITRLLEKVLKLNHLFMVVGQPGAGKSTFLQLLTKIDQRHVHINTDDFNQLLKPQLKKFFATDDLVQVALDRAAEVNQLLAQPWLALLILALKHLPAGSNAFVEIPFGLQPDKQMFRFVGGKILSLGCSYTATRQRVIDRHTPELLPFVDKIPNWSETWSIVRDANLSVAFINTNGSLADLKHQAEQFNTWLMKGADQWQTYLPGCYLAI